jgi:hypothetical protein
MTSQVKNFICQSWQQVDQSVDQSAEKQGAVEKAAVLLSCQNMSGNE